MKSSILVISESAEITGSVTQVLASDGYEVASCDRPKEVISLLRNESFDVVLLDAHLTEAPYEKLIEVIRKVAPTAEVVLITSHLLPDAVKHDMLDANLYLIQPITDDKVRNVIGLAMRQAGLTRKNRNLLFTVTAAKKQWEAVVDAIDDPIFLTDFDHNIQRANLATYRRLGRGVDKVLGKKCYEIMHCSSQMLSDCPGKRAMASGEMVSDIVLFKGLRQRLSCDVYPQVFSGGGLVHHLHAPTISYETQAEMMTTYECAFDKAAVPILLIDIQDYKVIDANQRALEFFAREPERIFNIALENLFVPDASESAINNIIAQLETQAGSFRTRIVDGRGKEKDVYIIASNVEVRSRHMAEIFVIPIDLL